jgi:hypothetical protein
MRLLCLSATVLALGLASAASPAFAACFESGIGCTDTDVAPYSALRKLSCDTLWTVRNTIFHEHGYCFQTAKALAVFDNTGCRYTSAAEVPLNAVGRTNVSRVTRVEREKHC